MYLSKCSSARCVLVIDFTFFIKLNSFSQQTYCQTLMTLTEHVFWYVSGDYFSLYRFTQFVQQSYISHSLYIRSWGSPFSIVPDYRLDDRVTGVQSLAEAKGPSSILCPDHLWGPHSQWILGVLSPEVKRSLDMMLTTDLHLVPRSRMSRNYSSSPPCCLHGGSRTALLYSLYIRGLHAFCGLQVENPWSKCSECTSFLCAIHVSDCCLLRNNDVSIFFCSFEGVD
jgi:hypothetical protein